MYSDPIRPKRDPRPYQKRTGFWYVRFSQRGRHPNPRWIATGVRTPYRKDWRAHVPAEVQAAASDWGRLWRDGRYDPWSDDRPGRITAEDAVERYIEARRAKTKSRQTMKSLTTTLRPFARSLTPGLLISQVQPRHVRAFITRPDLSAYSRNVYFNRLRTFFKYCRTRRWLYDDPTEGVERPPEPRTTRSIFLPADLERILCAVRADLQERTRDDRTVCTDAYELAAATGMRRAELCSRTWGDVDLARNLIRVDDNPDCGFTVKTEESRRVIPLFPRALQVLSRREALRRSEDPSEPVLLAPRGRYNDPDWISKRFTEHRKLAGLRKGSIHSLRHTFITYCLALGMPESKVMAIVGQTKYDTVKRYTHMVEELLQEAPDAALARFLPGYESRRTPRLLTEIAAFLAGEKAPAAGENVDYLLTGI